MFEETAARRGLANSGIVEKDFWVCWTLSRLYSIPSMPRLLFKGGTSLSQCFGLIHRFSEDIDLGIEREDVGLVDDLDPMAQSTRSGCQRAVKAMRAKLYERVAETLFPSIEADFQAALDGLDFRLHPPEASGGEPTIRFEYPWAFETSGYSENDYVAPTVQLELGARADHEPVRTVAIRSYAAEEFGADFKEPECTVTVQGPERTLLEKALIIHEAIHKGRIKGRSSRHAYDLAMMHRDAGTMAAVSRELYERVARHTFVFGDNKKVGDAPREGIRLVPEGALLDDLEADYRAMQPMFFTEPAAPSFEEVLDGLRQLEEALNALGASNL
ncbi:MAG: nucleotidyl transferase AbiEii/AbiGii toxin family protein [Planctomycetota bacterium]